LSYIGRIFAGVGLKGSLDPVEINDDDDDLPLPFVHTAHARPVRSFVYFL
jgi:hypothetical protein